MSDRLTCEQLRQVRLHARQGRYNGDSNELVRRLADQVTLLEHALKSANTECRRRGDALLMLTKDKEVAQ